MSCEHTYYPKCSPIWGGKRYGRYIAGQQFRAYKTSWSRKTGLRRLLPRLHCQVTPTSIRSVPSNRVLRLKMHLLCHCGGLPDWRKIPGVERCKGSARYETNIIGHRVGIIKRRRYEQQWGLLDEVYHDCDE